MAAVTFGELTARILTDTNRGDSDLSDPNTGLPLYPAAIQRAILSAIYLAESNYFWVFQKLTQITIAQGDNSIALPADFNKLIRAQAIINGNFYGPAERFLNITYNELLSYYSNTAQQGIAQYYALWMDTLYIYPYGNSATPINLYYYYKDTIYPTVNGQLSNSDSSIWFGTATVDLIRLKAMQLFYTDTLQAPDLGAAYAQEFMEFETNLFKQNNLRNSYNLLSI